MKLPILTSYRKPITGSLPTVLQIVGALLLSVSLMREWSRPAAKALDATPIDQIDPFVESERKASGIPGIALAILHEGAVAHVHGFGEDWRGNAIPGDTSFPIGSLTKSPTALLVRQAVDAGQRDVDSPVHRYLPWFRVADADVLARITLRHLLNQTSGSSRADGIAPLLPGSAASIDDIASGLSAASLNRPLGERFGYSDLNFVLLGAVLQAVTGRSWQDLIQAQVFQPLQITYGYTDHHAERQASVTTMDRMWFGMPFAQDVSLLPGFAPAVRY